MMLRLSIAALLLLATGSASAQSAIYRCGNEYTRVPCAQGRILDTLNSGTTAAQRAEAARVAARERRLAEEMARDRRRAQAELQPASAASVGPQKTSAAAPKASAAKSKKKPAAKRPADQGEDFVAGVPKPKK
jgi:hypothetical protein